MKIKTTILLVLMATCALGESWFPEFETFSPENQQMWGFNIQRVGGNNPSIFISVPPKTARYCTVAKTYIRNNKGQVIAEINASLTENKDGSKSITLNLFDTIEGSAELIVYMRQTPDAPAVANFGGFSFKLKN